MIKHKRNVLTFYHHCTCDYLFQRHSLHLSVEIGNFVQVNISIYLFKFQMSNFICTFILSNIYSIVFIYSVFERQTQGTTHSIRAQITAKKRIVLLCLFLCTTTFINRLSHLQVFHAVSPHLFSADNEQSTVFIRQKHTHTHTSTSKQGFYKIHGMRRKNRKKTLFIHLY